MRDCVNAEIRDRLPDLLHGRLDPSTRAAVLAHVEGCADCRDELTLLREVHTITSVAPSVDVGRIVAALPAPGRVVRPGARGWSRWGAGVAVALAAGLGALMVIDGGEPSTAPAPGAPAPSVEAPVVAVQPEGAPDLAAPSATSGATAIASARATTTGAPVRELAVASELGDVSDGALESLLTEIEALDALPASEPEDPLPVPSRGGRS